jgi:hypothetical protein
MLATLGVNATLKNKNINYYQKLIKNHAPGAKLKFDCPARISAMLSVGCIDSFTF